MQQDRTVIINMFKAAELPILVATDVAARGLDVKHVHTVVNYDSARDINAHVHRIGRTGSRRSLPFAISLSSSFLNTRV